MSVYHQVQVAINGFVGIAPGLTAPVKVDGDIGSETARAAGQVGTYLYDKGWGRAAEFTSTPNFGKPARGFIGQNGVTFSAADLAHNAALFVNILVEWLLSTGRLDKVSSVWSAGKLSSDKTPSSPPVEPSSITSLTPAASAPSSGKLWYILAVLTVIGTGVAGYLVYRRKAS